MIVTPDDDAEEARRPKLSSRTSSLRKLTYDSGFKISLGKWGEEAGFERGDRVIPETEEGSIILLEVDSDDPPDDARSLRGEQLRLYIPSALLSPLGLSKESYDPEADPVVFDLDPYPDEEGYPSAIELAPLGFASGILDEDQRLLPPDDWEPSGSADQDEGREDLEESATTATGRELAPVGIGKDVIDLAVEHYAVDRDELQETLDAVSTVDDDVLSSVDGYPPLESNHRSAHFPPEHEWEEIARDLEIPEELVEPVQWTHRREAQQLIGEAGNDDHRSFSTDDIVPIVLPE